MLIVINQTLLMNLDSSEACVGGRMRTFACQGDYHILILKLFYVIQKNSF